MSRLSVARASAPPRTKAPKISEFDIFRNGWRKECRDRESKAKNGREMQDDDVTFGGNTLVFTGLT